MERFDVDRLDDLHPFDVDRQLTHLAKHAGGSMSIVREVWEAEPLFYAARPPAHWIMTAEIDGEVWQVPLAPSDSGDPRRCRPIGCYRATAGDAATYRRDR